ncbi:MAG: PHP domain-containing protein [Armatimonadota bacterium]
MSIYEADLHIHTILSPCAEVEMIPPFIVERAIEVGLDIIAITDHNSAENVQAVIDAADGSALKVLPGIECETLEGVHLICLFDTVQSAMEMQEIIYASLPNLPNRPETFGAQFVVDSTGDFIRYNERLLLVPTGIPLEDVVEAVNRLGGLAIPAHVDRPSYGIYGVLGFLPDEPVFNAVEISKHLTPDQAASRYPDLDGKSILCSSDAHRLEEIGTGRCRLDMKHRSVACMSDIFG